MIKYYVGKQEPNITDEILLARCARLRINDVESIQTLCSSWSCIVQHQHHAEMLDSYEQRMVSVPESVLHTILSYDTSITDSDWEEAIKQIRETLA